MHFEILRKLPSRRHVGLEVLLCRLPDNSVTPYVTWVTSPYDQGRHWGHYHSTLREALDDFYERAQDWRSKLLLVPTASLAELVYRAVRKKVLPFNYCAAIRDASGGIFISLGNADWVPPGQYHINPHTHA